MSADGSNPPHGAAPGPAGTPMRLASRAGLKLAHALDRFGIDPSGLTCADFGCNVGGFTDCLLQRGAACVHAIDTGYGALAWTLRNDPRVRVHERTNALHMAVPEGGADLVTIDMSWTPLRLSVPVAVRWLEAKPEGAGLALALVKPHYETLAEEKALLRRGALEPDAAARVTARVLAELPALGVSVEAECPSPLTGGKSGAGGNVEHLCLLRLGGPSRARARVP